MSDDRPRRTWARPGSGTGWQLRLLVLVAAAAALAGTLELSGGPAEAVVVALVPLAGVASVRLPTGQAAMLGAVVGVGAEAVTVVVGGEPSVLPAVAAVVVAVVASRVWPPRGPAAQPVSNR